MARILQDTDPGPILHPISETSPSSSVVFVGGNFTMTIADSLTATVLTNTTTSVYLMVNNSNPVTGQPPAGGHTGEYSDETAFASRWVPLANVASMTAYNGQMIYSNLGASGNVRGPVRYIALSANAGAEVPSLKQCFSGSLSGFVYSDYSACKTH